MTEPTRIVTDTDRTVTLHIDVDLTVQAAADPIVVADKLLEILWAYEDDVAPIFSIDGAEPIRSDRPTPAVITVSLYDRDSPEERGALDKLQRQRDEHP